MKQFFNTGGVFLSRRQSFFFIFHIQYAEKIIRKKVQIGRISGILEVKSPENDKKRNKKALVLTT